MASSTIPAAKAALLAILQGRPALANVVITYAVPANTPAEWIWLRSAEGHQQPAALGLQRRDEHYALTIVVSILRAGRDVQKAGERAFVFVSEIEAALRADASLGGLVRVAQLGELTYQEFQNDRQCEGRVTLEIECAARI